MALHGPSTLNLSSWLAPERVVFLPAGIAKPDALGRLCDVLSTTPAVGDAIEFRHAIRQREEVSSTGIGGGIAVPHAKLQSISGFAIAVGISPDGIEFGARDNQPVDVMVMIAASEDAREAYLRVLASVAATLKDDARRTALREAASAEAAIAALCHDR